MRTVLIFAHQCHPFERRASTIGGQRAYQFAKWLPDFGWRAEVLTCPSSDATTWRVGGACRVGRDGSSVIASVEPDADAGYLDRAWRRCIYSQSPHARHLRRVLTLALMPRGDWSRAWVRPAIESGFGRIDAGRRGSAPSVDVLMAEHGPDAGLHAARVVAARTGLPWVADFRDSILGPYKGVARRIYGKYARRAVRGAAAVVHLNPLWSRIDGAVLNKPSTIIANGFDPDEVVSASKPDDQFKITLFGNFQPGSRLDMVGEAIAKFCGARQATPRLALEYYGMSPEPSAMAVRYGITAYLQSRGHVPRPDVMRALASSHAVLMPTIDSSTTDEPLFSAGLVSAKVYEVMALGVPMVCFPGDSGIGDALVTECNAGEIVRSAEDLTATLQAWYEAWEAGRPFGPNPDVERIARLSRREGARQLAELLERVFTEGSRANQSEGVLPTVLRRPS